MSPSLAAFTALLVLCELQPVQVGNHGTGDTSNAVTKSKIGITLTLRCDEPSLKVGDEVPITFVVQNEGNTEYTHIRSHDYLFELVVVDENGARVADPERASRGIIVRQGFFQTVTAGPGQSFTENAMLNSWAALTKPGNYRVTGIYRVDEAIISPPITIKLEPRTNEEMGAYIEGLIERLKASQDDDARVACIRKLAYTCDRRTVSTLIEAMYEGDGKARQMAGAAFDYYLPLCDGEITGALLKAAADRGLASGMGPHPA